MFQVAANRTIFKPAGLPIALSPKFSREHVENVDVDVRILGTVANRLSR